MLKISRNAIKMLLSKYRSVLRNMRLREAAIITACCLLTFAPATSGAETVDYNDTSATLKTAPIWFLPASSNAASLFPGVTGSTLYSNNTVRIFFTPSNKPDPEYVIGGLSQSNAVTGNTVDFSKGNVIYDIYVGYFGGSTAQNVSGNTVNISGDATVGKETNKGAGFPHGINAIVDADRQEILNRSEVYSGVYGRASVNFYAFNSNGNKGIACALNNLQKIRDGEPHGGKSLAEYDFASYDEDFLA